jgi:hypothetical protein
VARDAAPASEARLFVVARAALSDPPDDGALQSLSPTTEEGEHFRNILRLKKEEPGSPLLVTLRRRVAGLDAIRMTFSQDKLITTTPSGTQIESYTAEGEVGDQLVVMTGGEGPAESRRALLRFVDDDHIVLLKGYREIPFYRTGASPLLASSNATLTADAAAAAEPGMPEKTGDAAFDGCVADYFDCVKQMPPESQDAMKSSLDLVRLRMRQAAKESGRARLFRGDLQQHRQAHQVRRSLPLSGGESESRREATPKRGASRGTKRERRGRQRERG